jgi:glycosyltransferase involved in cell wall biosynthesis
MTKTDVAATSLRDSAPRLTPDLCIGVDAISAGEGLGRSIGAMSVYFEGLLGALCERPEVGRIVSFVQPWSDGLGMPRHPKLELVRCSALPRRRVGRIAYEQTLFPLRVSRRPVDVLFSTCNTRPLLVRRPSVVVLQSIQYVLFPAYFGRVRRAYLNTAVPASLRTADAVIAVSEWEREEAICRFGLDPQRVFAVHHGVSNSVRGRTEAAVPEAPAERPYVVMVSTLYGFKNQRRLIEAFAKVVRSDGVDHELRIAGGDADVTRDDLRRLADELGVSDRVKLIGPVPHDDVPSLVANADVVAYPSLCETFGLPILEALALGRCLVTSNVTSMPEVAGDAAVLVDPYDVDSIAEGLRSAMLDERRRSFLREAGPRRAAQFTWERCAGQTLSVLRFAVERRR